MTMPCYNEAKVIGWFAVYDDLSTHSSKITFPVDLPVDGIQWIIEYLDGGGKRNVHGMDYYRWTGDSWAGGHIGDLRGWLRLRNEIPIILYGRWISDGDYQKVREIVQGLRYDD